MHFPFASFVAPDPENWAWSSFSDAFLPYHAYVTLSMRQAWGFYTHCSMPVSSYIPMSFNASLSLHLEFSWINELSLICHFVSWSLFSIATYFRLSYRYLQDIVLYTLLAYWFFLPFFVLLHLITLLLCLLRQNMQSDYWEPLWSMNWYAWIFLLRTFLCYSAVSLTVTKPIYKY